jgi:hypothetical protein
MPNDSVPLTRAFAQAANPKDTRGQNSSAVPQHAGVTTSTGGHIVQRAGSPSTVLVSPQCDMVAQVQQHDKSQDAGAEISIT